MGAKPLLSANFQGIVTGFTPFRLIFMLNGIGFP